MLANERAHFEESLGVIRKPFGVSGGHPFGSEKTPVPSQSDTGGQLGGGETGLGLAALEVPLDDSPEGAGQSTIARADALFFNQPYHNGIRDTNCFRNLWGAFGDHV